MKWIEETVKPEIENGSCKPRHVKVEKKKYNSDETYVVKKVAFYFPEHFKSVEWEDWDDYNEKDYPYTENDEVKGIVWLRPGWYESIDCDNCDGYWSSPLKVIEWLDETAPLPSTPAREVTDEEIENAAKEFAADYGYYPNQIITAFKEGAKFIAGYKAHQGKQ